MSRIRRVAAAVLLTGALLGTGALPAAAADHDHGNHQAWRHDGHHGDRWHHGRDHDRWHHRRDCGRNYWHHRDCGWHHDRWHHDRGYHHGR